LKKVKVEAIYGHEKGKVCKRPLYVARVSAGFPSPADDYLEGRLDLNAHLVQHPAATFFVRVSGDSMIQAGIHTGDILIVDRSLEPADKNVVIAAIDGELTVKRIRMKDKKLLLVPENEEYETIAVDAEREFEVWGVVTHVIHSF
jgi:DNA polymerase V